MLYSINIHLELCISKPAFSVDQVLEDQLSPLGKVQLSSSIPSTILLAGTWQGREEHHEIFPARNVRQPICVTKPIIGFQEDTIVRYLFSSCVHEHAHTHKPTTHPHIYLAFPLLQCCMCTQDQSVERAISSTRVDMPMLKTESFHLQDSILFDHYEEPDPKAAKRSLLKEKYHKAHTSASSTLGSSKLPNLPRVSEFQKQYDEDTESLGSYENMNSFEDLYNDGHNWSQTEEMWVGNRPLPPPPTTNSPRLSTRPLQVCD